MLCFARHRWDVALPGDTCFLPWNFNSIGGHRNILIPPFASDIMEKGLEINFTVTEKDAPKIVEALANLVGNEFSEQIAIRWKVFDVTLEEKRFYKVCFTGHKLTKLHPHMEEMVKNRFDELAHLHKDELMRMYHKSEKNQDFRVEHIEAKQEEYDLWQDNFWKFF